MPPLPFELQVLEVVLGDVVALASQLARDLEAVVHPALDSLMKSVSECASHNMPLKAVSLNIAFDCSTQSSAAAQFIHLDWHTGSSTGSILCVLCYA